VLKWLNRSNAILDVDSWGPKNHVLGGASQEGALLWVIGPYVLILSFVLSAWSVVSAL